MTPCGCFREIESHNEVILYLFSSLLYVLLSHFTPSSLTSISLIPIYTVTLSIGRAYAEFDQSKASPSFDGVFREWKKSDPATSAAYDAETVDYIVNR